MADGSVGVSLNAETKPIDDRLEQRGRRRGGRHERLPVAGKGCVVRFAAMASSRRFSGSCSCPRGRQLKDRRQRLRDPYELGDLQKAEYVAKREAIDAELAASRPARHPMSNAHARCLKTSDVVAQLIERVWIDDKRVIAIRPTAAFAPSFSCEGRNRRSQSPRQATRRRGGSNYGSDGTRLVALHTGGSRSASADRLLHRHAGGKRYANRRGDASRLGLDECATDHRGARAAGQ